MSHLHPSVLSAFDFCQEVLHLCKSHALVLLVSLCFLSTLFSSCHAEEDLIVDADDVELIFSADTISFDTVFSNNRNITKRLKVYNPIKNAIKLNQIKVVGEEASAYRIIINGLRDFQFENIRILGNDSLLVLVEVLAPEQASDEAIRISDQIEFSLGRHKQHVELESWGQDVILLEEQLYENDIVFDAQKPYMVKGTQFFSKSTRIRITEGVRFYMAPDTYFIIEGQLEATGSPEQPILFRNNRLDETFKNASGQWGGIVISNNAETHQLRYVNIRNSLFGINVVSESNEQRANIAIQNCIFQNINLTALIALGADCSLTNSLITNCGEGAIAFYGGGNLSLRHCTLALFPYENFREGSVLLLNDEIRDNTNQLFSNELDIILINSIVYGSRTEEIEFQVSENNAITIEQRHNILKSNLSFLNDNNSILNENPGFISAEKYQYGLTENSIAIGAATSSDIEIDLYGKARSNPADIGAIEFDPDLIIEQ